MTSRKQPFGRAERNVLLFTATYLVVASAVAAWRGNREFVFYLAGAVSAAILIRRTDGRGTRVASPSRASHEVGDDG